MPDAAAIAKAAWLDSLARHRRAWPEWAELEQRVRERTFVTQSIGPHRFLFADAGAARDQPPLSRQIASRGARVPEASPPLPGWIAPLVGLGCQDAGDLASAGVIAGDLWPPDRVARIRTPADWERAWHSDPPRELPDPTFVLQRNRSGTPLFTDGRRVLSFAHDTESLKAIADLEPFTRFCLRHSLIGEDWVVALRRGDGASEGLRCPSDF